MPDFERTFRKYHPLLFAYARKFIGDEDRALDLVQDVFTIFWEKKKMSMDEDYLKAFLFHALRNTCLNHLKHQAVIQKHKEGQLSALALEELEYYKSGEQSLIEQEDLDKIYKAIATLSEVHREVIELSRFEGLKNKEIAERLNIPLRTVETRLFRALSALRAKLPEKTFLSLFFYPTIR
ncbi:MAG: RNA polymerase sigma-70 factor [Prolixibacteraceae bacterium]